MHIRHIKIRNVRSIRSLDWELPESNPGAGWHVVVGDNGSGKSTFLRSAALALIGPKDALSLRLPWDDWLRKGDEKGSTEVRIHANPEYDKFFGKGPKPKSATLGLGMHFLRVRRRGPDPVKVRPFHEGAKPSRWAWGSGAGWFCAGFGPFRRFTGGDPEDRYVAYRFPKLARYLSIFNERVALTESVQWLQDLKFKSLEVAEKSRDHSARAGLLPSIFEFINQPDFLPFRARLEEITSDSVRFVDGNGMDVRIEDLSDGYRSILSMTFELIRLLEAAFGPSRLFDPNDPTRVLPEGVVLIDEIDVHLHPTWQRRVGFWFRKHFPNIQFLVTTHSPLICPAASVGSIYLLPRPGEVGGGAMLRGTKLKRLIDGNVLDAYGTDVFGKGVTRSEHSKAMLRRLAELNALELTEGLSPAQRKEQEERAGSQLQAGARRARDVRD
jgi:energy-coupling factor transporter ATP-binding protein EcfA2